ncbi:MAG: lipase family protein [Planctomycetaceae bacterium]
MPGCGGHWLRRLMMAAIASACMLNLIAVDCLAGDDVLAQANPLPTISLRPVERLEMAWNSEAAPDWPAAEVLATISKLTYLPPSTAEHRFRTLGFQRIRPFQANTLSGYVVSAGDVAVIGFRGTYDASEWLVNLGSLSYYTPEGDVHEGYYRAYRSLKPQVLKLLAESRPRKIWITGHSLGGALALICAYDLMAEEKLKPYGLMTFGQPMVVDRFLAAHLDRQLLGRYVHFVNEEDIVPRLPPGFAHCGSLVWFTQGEIRRSPPKLRTPPRGPARVQSNHQDVLEPLSDQEFAALQQQLESAKGDSNSVVRTSATSRQAPLWIRDHSMTLYLEKIERISSPLESP